jgi:hypothetical protein
MKSGPGGNDIDSIVGPERWQVDSRIAGVAGRESHSHWFSVARSLRCSFSRVDSSTDQSLIKVSGPHVTDSCQIPNTRAYRTVSSPLSAFILFTNQNCTRTPTLFHAQHPLCLQRSSPTFQPYLFDTWRFRWWWPTTYRCRLYMESVPTRRDHCSFPWGGKKTYIFIFLQKRIIQPTTKRESPAKFKTVKIVSVILKYRIRTS